MVSKKSPNNPTINELLPFLRKPRQLLFTKQLSPTQFCCYWYYGQSFSGEELEEIQSERGFKAKCCKLLAAAFGISLKTVESWYDRDTKEFKLPATIQKQKPHRLSEVLLWHQAQLLLTESESPGVVLQSHNRKIALHRNTINVA